MQNNLRMKTLKAMFKDAEPKKYVLEVVKSRDRRHTGTTLTQHKICLQRTLIPFVSSSSNDPMSKASAALTSPLGGINGGGYFCR